MSGLSKTLLYILGGVFVYAVGQIISKFFIEPIYKQFKLIKREIPHSLVSYAKYYYNPQTTGGSPASLEASRVLHSQSSSLRMSPNTIRGYEWLERLKIVPKQNVIDEASSLLRGISNSMGVQGDGEVNVQRANKIATLLNIKGFQIN